MEGSKIQWTDNTFNPWIGCTKVSEGCQFCYAETLNQRWRKGRNWGKGATRERTKPDNWKEPLKWARRAQAEGTRPRVFCASLSDVFDPEVPAEWLHDLLLLIEATPGLDWLLLTKRITDFPNRIQEANTFMGESWLNGFPPANVWLGVSAENQARWNERVPLLMATPAAVRFVSAEPLLGPIDFYEAPESTGLPDWIIIGGESGPNCRPMKPEWAASLAWQSQKCGMHVFVKQMGGHPNKRGDLEDIPDPLRIREFPGLKSRDR